MWTDTFWNGLGASSVFTAITQIAFGSIFSQLKLFLLSEEDFKKRTVAKHESLTESVNVMLDRLLEKAVEYPPGKLRGAPPADPDLVADYTASCFTVYKIRTKLDHVCSKARGAYSWLFTTFLIGVAFLLLSGPFEALRPWTAIISLLFILSQFIAVWIIRRCADQLEQHEGATHHA